MGFSKKRHTLVKRFGTIEEPQGCMGSGRMCPFHRKWDSWLKKNVQTCGFIASKGEGLRQMFNMVGFQFLAQ